MTVRATWNDVVLAESDKTVVLEGNHYFPPEAVHWELPNRQRHPHDVPLDGAGQLLHRRRERRPQP